MKITCVLSPLKLGKKCIRISILKYTETLILKYDKPTLEPYVNI